MELFGFKIQKSVDKRDLRKQSFVNPSPDDGAAVVSAGGYYGTYVDLDATAKSESDLITRYRQASLFPECDSAIEEIVSEAIASMEDEQSVEINLDDLDELSENIKEIVRDQFQDILQLLKFSEKGHDIFRRWYIDGRIYYHKVIDASNPRRGIQELRYIDPRKIRKVRNIQKEKMKDTGVELIKTIEEFYIYNEQGIATAVGAGFGMPSATSVSGIKISTDSIAYCPSGLIDMDKNVVLSYLHKAIKPVNQLKMMEDATVIYRISRAPERRIFYIDVGNLPKLKAEQYLKGIMDRYRNKIVYDSSTGEIRDDRKFMSMLEDFWLPRREGGRGTEITTLPGGENLGEMADVEYFKNKLYQSLNVPITRLQPQDGMNFGRAAEITREELKFAKFVSRLRKKFNTLFNDLLKTQLILTGVITDADWEVIEQKINYRYAQDQYFKEMKDAETLRARVELLQIVQPYVGTYYSQNYVKRNVLHMTDNDIKEIDAEIQAEPPPVPIGPMGPIINNDNEPQGGQNA